MYEGEWYENKINGTGVYVWPDGRKYDGEWKDNNMHGKGVYTWKDGEEYDGQWKNGLFHGKGTKKLPEANGNWTILNG